MCLDHIFLSVSDDAGAPVGGGLRDLPGGQVALGPESAQTASKEQGI